MNVETLAALAETNRMKIVELLRRGPHTVNEVAEQLAMRQPQASKHLKVLSEAGLVLVEPVANQRFYRLNPQPFAEIGMWVASYAQVVEEQYSALDELLEEMKRGASGSP
jgi:DNA-binding transcriptional ArsR family regulator